MAKNLNILKHKTSEELETKGNRLEWNCFYFHVKRAGGANKEFHKKFQEMVSNFTDISEIKDEIIERKTAEVISEALVCGWEGIQDEDGNDVEYNAETMAQLLIELPDLSLKIQEFAQQRRNFLSIIEAVKKK